MPFCTPVLNPCRLARVSHRAGCQPRHGEVPVRVGDHTPRQAGIEIPDDNVDAGQDATGFVFDGAGDGR